MTYAPPVNITTAMEMFRYSNEITGVFGVGIQISLFLVVLIFLSKKGESVPHAAMTASFMTTIVSVFLLLGGLITQGNFFLAVLLTALSTLWAYWGN